MVSATSFHIEQVAVLCKYNANYYCFYDHIWKSPLSLIPTSHVYRTQLNFIMCLYYLLKS